MITLNELKTNYLGIATSEVGKDTQLQIIIDVATKSIEQYCGQVLLQRSTVTDYQLNSRYLLEIQAYNVPMTITNVIGGDYFAPSGWSTITSDEYEFSLVNGWYAFFLKDSADFRRYVRITANVGWVVANIPIALKEACGRMCVEMIEESRVLGGVSRLGLSSVNEQTAVGSTSQTYYPVLDNVVKWLADYRRVSL